MSQPLPDLRSDQLRERLLQAGVAPRHVRRYLRELADHLADLMAEEKQSGRNPADAEAEALARLGRVEDLAKAMIDQREFQSWSARAPWAIFGLGPVFLLAAAWFIACLILWAGWNAFLPGADTPFGHRNSGPIYALENIYFQADKFYYFAAPLLVAWGIALIAARQRVKTVWPIASFILLSWMAATSQIYASRSTVPGGLGHIRMTFAAGPSLQGSLLHALVIFSLAALPYLIWRRRNTPAHSA